MKYSFDEKMERIGNHAAKWEELDRNFGTPDLWPMWIADMDFKTAPEILEALKKKVEYGFLAMFIDRILIIKRQLNGLRKDFLTPLMRKL